MGKVSIRRPLPIGIEHLEVRPIATVVFRRFLAAAGGASYQQTPEWAEIRRAQWRPELLGWFDSHQRLIGVAVVRYRNVPGLDRSLAFIPQGPLIPWDRLDLGDLLDALASYLRARKVFAIRVSPPLHLRSWRSDTVRDGLANPRVQLLTELEPDGVDAGASRAGAILRDQGWRAIAADTAFENSQPRFNFRLPLGGCTEATLLEGMSKTWRRSIRRAARDGVQVRAGTAEDIPAVHRLHVETARRNGFSPHPVSFFESVWNSYSEGSSGLFHLHVGFHEKDLLSADAMIQIGHRAQGLFAANSSMKRDLTTSNAVYWERIRQAMADGADEFEFGGVSPVLDLGHPDSGLVRFKTGLGGEMVEDFGAWDLPLQPAVYRAFTALSPLYSAAVSRWRSKGVRSSVES